MKELWKVVREVESQVIAWRRDIHAHPELGFEEVRTAGLIAEVLKKLGLSVRTGIAQTGVTADLDVGARTRIALRADMDALKMTEENDAEYRSKNEGVAHMCGHDAHVAMLLGTATALSRMKDQLTHNVRFIFQPSEESPPGGAIGMLRAGVLEDIDEVYAIHVDATVEAGLFKIRTGASLASADEIELVIEGKGGHAAAPHLTHDPVVAAAEVILAIQTIASRRIEPIDPVVVSICQTEAGTAFNVIPSKVRLRGTYRTMCDKTRQEMPGLISEVASAAASVHRCRAALTVTEGYPMTVNDPRTVGRVHDVVSKLFEEPEQIGQHKPRMGAEDFSFFLENKPGSLIWLGIRNAEKGIVHAHHHPRFDLDEDALVNGVALLSGLALYS